MAGKFADRLLVKQARVRRQSSVWSAKRAASPVLGVLFLRAFATVLLLSPLLFVSGCLSHSLTAIQVNPSSMALSVGQSAQLTAQGSLTENNHATDTSQLTSEVSWTSSDPAVATVSSGGMVAATGAGTATITASIQGSFGPLTASSTITVTASTHVLSSITVTPPAQTITAGSMTQYRAIGSYSGGTPATSDLSTQVTWSSSNATVATVGSGGMVVGVSAGTATLTATYQGAGGVSTGTATVTVVSSSTSTRTLTSLSIIPASQVVTTLGETAQLIAIGTYAGGSPVTADLTDQVSWSSSDTQVGQITHGGAVTAGGVAGSATMVATMSAADGSAITSTSTFQNTLSGQAGLPNFAVYLAGTGLGTVTGTVNGAQVIDCNNASLPGQTCSGYVSTGTVVTLTITPNSGSQFDGSSPNCSAQLATPSATVYQCTVTMGSSDVNVGLILDKSGS